jgi:predicted hydrocarbon binding protein
MDRALLEHMLRRMKKQLIDGASIGNLKVGALFALGSQLEAIFYFMGHELGSKIGEGFEKRETKVDKIVESLRMIAKEYHLGEFKLEEKTEEHITFDLIHCGSCSDFPPDFTSEATTFCSFEAGLFAGIVEKLTNTHVFAQELACRLQGNPSCQFMIVIPKDE